MVVYWDYEHYKYTIKIINTELPYSQWPFPLIPQNISVASRFQKETTLQETDTYQLQDLIFIHECCKR